MLQIWAFVSNFVAQFSSVPEDKDALGLESILSLDNVFGEVFAIVADLSPHVVDKEGLGEVVFVVRIRHGLEVKSHRCTALNITDLVAARGRVAVRVKEFGQTLSVLGEKRVIDTLFPLLIEVHHVVGLWVEEAAQLFVGEHLIKNIDLINSGLGALISDSSSSHARSGEEVQLPERSVSEHHEAEAAITNEATSPHVVGSVQTGANLVEIVTSSHSPFPVVGTDHVGHVVELRWVSLGLGSLTTFGAVIGGVSANVVSVETLGRLEAHIVVAGFVVLSESELRGRGKESLALLLHHNKIQ